MYFDEEKEQIFKKLDSSILGLSSKEAEKRQEKYGKNILVTAKKEKIIIKFLNQFKDLTVLILILASIISGVIDIVEGKVILNTYIILAIVFINALIGLFQELRAEKAQEALKKLVGHTQNVIRDGKVVKLDSSNLVCGDIVELFDGDYISADMRLLEVVNLKVIESSLTGESVPIEKTDVVLAKDTELADRKNMVYSSSLVTYGRAKAIVVNIGMDTEVGKIATMLEDSREVITPLKQKLNHLGKTLATFAGIICIIIFIIGIMIGIPIFDMLIISISLAVAAIPEGLPAIATIVQALGIQKMVKKNAIVKKIHAVESLGNATVICSDKTGTLTKNEMTVVRHALIDQKYTQDFFNSLVLCNNANISLERQEEKIGDPTEIALLDYVLKCLGKEKYIEILNNRRIYEIPFDSDKKYMVTVIEDNTNVNLNLNSNVNENDKNNKDNKDKKYIAYIKGGIDELITKTTLDKSKKEYIDIFDTNTEMAKKSLRVLSFGKVEISAKESEIDKILSEKLNNSQFEFMGLVGMIDPPREEAKKAIEICKSAGIRTIMITGDHALTANAIGRELGIVYGKYRVVLGRELNQMTDEQLEKEIDTISVFARVSPEHKVRIVKVLQNLDNVVAMTGDGVNDAPALKNAQIGCAMGITGTDVSKEAADVIITDDNFATIVNAVKEGRRISDNILKSIQYLLSSNIGELILILICLLTANIIIKMLNIPINSSVLIPLLPIHILWINLVTDSLPALALAEDEAKKGIMQRLPNRSKKIFDKEIARVIIYQGIMIGILAYIAFILGLIYGNENEKIQTAQTMAFLTLGLAELLHTFNVRDNTNSFIYKGMFKNRLLILSIVLNTILILSVIFIPILRRIFNLVLIPKTLILPLIILIIIPNIFVELIKFIKRRVKG